LFENRFDVGALAPLLDVRSRWLLRLIAESPRNQALSRSATPDYKIFRTRWKLALVLHRRGVRV